MAEPDNQLICCCPLCGEDIVVGSDTEEAECPNCIYQFRTPWGRVQDFLKAQELITENAKLKDKLGRILKWVQAYPLQVFPEPDLKAAAKVLKENGLSLDQISASSMRHVLNGIKPIIKEEST